MSDRLPVPEPYEGPVPEYFFNEAAEKFRLQRRSRVSKYLTRLLFRKNALEEEATELAIRAFYKLAVAEEEQGKTLRELQYMEESLETYRRDPLTDHLLRRAFIAETDAKREQIHSGETEHDTAAMFMLDLRRLKRINKTGGHPAGDEAITALGDGLGKVAINNPGIDAIVGRLGGDEFALMVSFNSGTWSLEGVDRQIRTEMAEIDKTTPYGLRVGKMAVSGPDKSAIDLFSEADPKKALKTRKEKFGKAILDLAYTAHRELSNRMAA